MERYVVMRVLLALFLLFVVVFAIVRIAGGPDEEVPVTEEEQEREYVLSEQINNDSEMKLTQVGETSGPEDHREIHFSITERRRLVEIKSGYNGNVIDSIRLTNTDESFEAFLFAIEARGFKLQWVDPVNTDWRGVCPLGTTFLYEAVTRGETRSELFSTSCSRDDGTFAGDRRDIVELFEAQFPDYSDFIRANEVRL